MRKRVSFTVMLATACAALSCSVGQAAARPLYAGCTNGDTNSPCYHVFPGAGYNSPTLIMQPGGDTDFVAVNLSSQTWDFQGCYGPSGTVTHCDNPKSVAPNAHIALVTNVTAGDGLYADISAVPGGPSVPSNLWFPYT